MLRHMKCSCDWVIYWCMLVLEHKTNNWVRSEGPQEPLLATVKRGNMHGSAMSHAMTTSPKPSFRTPWKVGDAVVVRENAGSTTSKSGHP